MSSSYRRGLAFVLKAGSWTDENPEAPTSLVLNAVKGQKNRRNPLSVTRGRGKLKHVLVVWTTRPNMKRLHEQIRNGKLGDASMDIVRLDPCSHFAGPTTEDFHMAKRRAEANTYRVRPSDTNDSEQPLATAASAGEETPAAAPDPSAPPPEQAPEPSPTAEPPASPAGTPAEAAPPEVPEATPAAAPEAVPPPEPPAQTAPTAEPASAPPEPASDAGDKGLPGQAEIVDLKPGEQTAATGGSLVLEAAGT